MKKVTKFLEDTGGLSDTQNGFRKTRSCLHHIFSLVTIAKNCCGGRKGRNAKMGCLQGSLPTGRHFDVIDRDLLVHRLATTGIKGLVLSLIRQMYKDTWSILRINDSLVKDINSNNGVLQGINISPTIFSVYLNGLLSELNKSGAGVKLGDGSTVSVLAYADDIVLLSNRIRATKAPGYSTQMVW